MSQEDKLIALINGVMPPSPLRLSGSGEVDAEVIRLGDREFLFTTDDFSAEDLFDESDPYSLGWNIACGAISDIVASGGKPLVYAHSMVVSPDWDDKYIARLSQGVASVLSRYSVSFIGGDLGVADRWRYTGTVIGTAVGRTVNRKGCRAGDSIFLTGAIGAGNLAAVQALFPGTDRLSVLPRGESIRFATHERMPELISSYASCAIDTSDGVFAALRTVSALNGTGFFLSKLPYYPPAALAADKLQLPELLLMLGECGEYEILFTVRPRDKASLQAELRRQGIAAAELGVVTADPGQRAVRQDKLELDLSGYSLQARDFTRVQDYVAAMLEWMAARGIKR
jgi:thiamine-monophosphate kinase